MLKKNIENIVRTHGNISSWYARVDRHNQLITDVWRAGWCSGSSMHGLITIPLSFYLTFFLTIYSLCFLLMESSFFRGIGTILLLRALKVAFNQRARLGCRFTAQNSACNWARPRASTGDSVCGHQVPCHRLIGALVRCNHPGGPKALNK
jgi:hypothetical protein